MRDKIKTFFELEDEIKKYFGYVEQWKVAPLENSLGEYWLVTSHSLVTSDEPFTKESIEEGMKIHDSEIVGDIVRKKKLTMIKHDLHVAMNPPFLAILDNELECKDQELIELYKECWL